MIPNLLRVVAALVVAGGLSSCVVYDDGYSGGGYDGGGYSGGGSGYYSGGSDGWDDDYYSYHPSAYPGYVSYSTIYPHYYGGRYYSYRWWDDNRYSHYRHNHGDNRHRYSSHRSSDEIRIIRNREGGRTPQGYHSREWYKDRGYSLKGNTYVDRSGETSGRELSRDRSRTSRSSSVNRERSSSRDSSADRERAQRASQSSGSRNSRDNARVSRDTRIASPHPRALQQPEKYRHTGRSGDSGSKGNGDRGRSQSGGGKDGDRNGKKK